MILTFEPIHHKYNDGKGISVSTLLGNYKEDFDDDFWLRWKAWEYILYPGDNKDVAKEKFRALRKDLKYTYDMMQNRSDILFARLAKTYPKLVQMVEEDIKDSIREQWNKKNENSKVKGSAYHDYNERESLLRGYEINPFDRKSYQVIKPYIWKDGIKTQIVDLHNLEEGYYPELILNMRDIFGQSDRVWINSKKQAYIRDYKGLALNTPIATPTGFTMMQDIKINDEIYDGEGKITTVQHVSNVHYNPCYKIYFCNGDTLIADHEHKWLINTRKHSSITNYFEIEMTTDQIFNHYSIYKNKNKLKIKTCNSLETEIKELPIDPYVLGLWLADGNRTCGTITCVNKHIWEEIKKRGYKISANHNRNNNKSESRTIYGISKELNKLKLLGNKHIPNIYFRSSHNQRLDLLRGYMDGDGYFNLQRNRCVMVTTSLQQATDLSELISTLGDKATIIKSKTNGFNKQDVQCYHICFSPDVSPFLIRNTDYKMVSGVHTRRSFKNKNRYITKIEKIDTIPTKCLSVTSSNKSYLAGYNLIKTHNTNEKIRTENKFQKMKAPLAHLDDCELSHYTIQLSLYAYILEDKGYEIMELGIDHFNTEITVPYLKKEVENIILDYEMSTI